ncbi:MAG: Coenzyme F420 hydrogenase/dehydrogenase, beta subunit C-terminal domain [Promethearchaeota archaeon]
MAQEKEITWEFLRNLADALDSYRVRAFIDGKKEILNVGVYSEEQYFSILFKMIEEEKLKYGLFEEIKEGKISRYHHLKKFAERLSISVRKAFNLLKLLQVENLIHVDPIMEEKIDTTEEQGENAFITPKIQDFKIKILNKDFLEVKSIYEPVRVIFESKTCSGCAMCTSTCPMNCLDMLNGSGKFEESSCIHCGLCYLVCPRTFFPIDVLNMTMSETDEFTNYPIIGNYLEIHTARTKINDIAKKCQDGGISSTILYYLFEKGMITLAIGTKMSNTLWKPEPVILNQKEDVLLTLGTKYVNNHSLKKLKEINGTENSIAVVGVPCMMQALLKSQIYDINIPFIKNIKYRIGIFCMESFSYQSLLEICKKLEVDINQVRKMDINKGKFFMYTKNGENKSIPIKEISPLAREECEVCPDLTSEAADISVGSIGSAPGFNTVIIRTQKGKKLYDELIENDFIESQKFENNSPNLSLLFRIANSKKNRCKKHLESKEKNSLRHPLYYLP